MQDPDTFESIVANRWKAYEDWLKMSECSDLGIHYPSANFFGPLSLHAAPQTPVQKHVTTSLTHSCMSKIRNQQTVLQKFEAKSKEELYTHIPL
jgi:hypothetical protein